MGGGEVEVGAGVAGGAGAAGDWGFATAVGGVVEGIAEGDCLAGQLYEECWVDGSWKRLVVAYVVTD